MTKNQAIRDARDAVSISQQGRQYIVGVYDADARAIRQSSPRDYWQAMHNASQARIDHARTALGLDLIQYNGGEWIQYLSADA
jgi:hypothetical protein